VLKIADPGSVKLVVEKGEKHIDHSLTLRQANIKAALNWHPNVLIRTPLIASFNADAKIIHRFVTFFQECGTGNARFELLKYHEYGRQKWDSCGLEYTMNKGYISDSLFRSLENIYKKAGLNVIRS